MEKSDCSCGGDDDDDDGDDDDDDDYDDGGSDWRCGGCAFKDKGKQEQEEARVGNLSTASRGD